MPKSRLYRCSECDQTFTRNNTRERHEQQVHNIGQPFKCSYCDATFSRFDYYSQDRHQCQEKRAALGGNDGHKCEICEKIFTRKDSLQKHLSQVHSEKRYNCSMCPASFAQSYKLKKHSEKHQVHPSTSSHKRQRNKTCRREYQGKDCHSNPVSRGQNQKDESPDYSSTGAGGSKEGIEDLKTRQTRSRKRRQLNKGISSFKCDICHKRFDKQGNLNRHVSDVHNESKGFSCPKCITGFARKERLERHLAEVHKEEKKLFCNECPKIFTRSEKLERHISEVHKKCKPFSCPDCPEKFSRYENLERHLRAGEHTITMDCKYCQQALLFKSLNAYRKHFTKDYLDKKTCVNKLQEQQKEEYSYTCSVCKVKYAFKSESECYNHKVDHQFTNPEKTREIACKTILSKFLSYQCAWCKESYSFKYTYEVLRHFNDHYMVDPCYKKMIMMPEERIRRGIPALNAGGLETTCAGLVKQDELEMKKYPMMKKRCYHLECARVTKKIIHPPSSFPFISLVSN